VKTGIHPGEGGTAFAGVTAFLTFYEITKIDEQVKSKICPRLAGGEEGEGDK
jgi:hypothetical protein